MSWMRLIAALMLFILAACALNPASTATAAFDGRPGLLQAIKQYYGRNAGEENGRCRSVLLDGVTRSELVSEDQDRVVVKVGYRYRSNSRNERGRGCGGFGERTFEAVLSGDLYRVVSMTGDRNEGGLRWRFGG